MCQRAGTDPFEVLTGQVDLAMKLILEASMTDPKVHFVSLVQKRAAILELMTSFDDALRA